VASGVFAVSFSVLSSSAALQIRGRVMSFAYVPVNVGFLVGAALGTLVTARDVFVIFPITAAVTALGTVALVIASRRLA
jgi:predicted MFS family arabinose efflux permease